MCKVSVLIDKKIKEKIVDVRGFRAEILEPVEIWPAGLVKGQDFAVYYCVLGEAAESLEIGGNCRLNDFLRLENKVSLSSDFTARARYPSSLIS
jgi:hypothetical protein